MTATTTTPAEPRPAWLAALPPLRSPGGAVDHAPEGVLHLPVEAEAAQETAYLALVLSTDCTNIPRPTGPMMRSPVRIPLLVTVTTTTPRAPFATWNRGASAAAGPGGSTLRAAPAVEQTMSTGPAPEQEVSTWLGR